MGVTRKDKIRNKYIRDTVKMGRVRFGASVWARLFRHGLFAPADLAPIYLAYDHLTPLALIIPPFGN